MNIKIFLLAGLLTVASAFSCSGSCPHPVVHTVAIFIDVTDPEHTATLSQHLQEELGSITKALETLGAFNECNQVKLSLYPINDLGENRGIHIISEVVLPQMTPTQVVRRVRYPFRTQIQNGLNAFFTEHYRSEGYDRTRIYEPLCLLLNRPGRPNNIIVYSDLLEHGTVSLYDRELGYEPEPILKEMVQDCSCSLPDTLNHTSLHLLSFRSRKNDALVRRARSFFTHIFKQRRATVVTGTGFQH